MYREEQIARLAASGWAECGSVASAVAQAGLPAVTEEYLAATFPAGQWKAAARAQAALEALFSGARYAADVTYGVLLVPDPAKLDTRQAMPPEVRRDQLGRPVADVFDRQLPAGRPGVRAGHPWSLVVTVIGRQGISLGSYEEVTGAPASAFTVGGEDTRALMTRQIWGARVLQSGAELPDCEANERWTFTLFPGEPLVDGAAESGTVLKGKVRFRLGKANRGIGPARVAPALAIR